MVDRVRTVPEIRQAMVAKLIRSATKQRKAAADIPAVRSAVDERFRDSIGDVGSWLLDNVVADPSGELAADELWDSLASEFGAQDNKIGGWTRQHLLRRLAPEVVPGWPTRAERRGVGGRSRVYPGVRLRPVKGSEPVNGSSRCQGCRRSPPPRRSIITPPFTPEDSNMGNPGWDVFRSRDKSLDRASHLCNAPDTLSS